MFFGNCLTEASRLRLQIETGAIRRIAATSVDAQYATFPDDWHLCAEVAVIINPDWIGSRDVFTSAQIPAVKPLKEFRAVANGAIWDETLQYLSAYAFVNPSDTNTASLRLSLINWHAPGVDFSRPIAEKVLQIPPRSRMPFVLNELFADILPISFITSPVFRYRGSLVIQSDSPIAAGGVDVFFPEGKFTSGVMTAQTK